MHYVDPGLDRLKQDTDFSEAVIREKVSQTLKWIAQCHADAILVTCTLFAAVLAHEAQQLSIPVIGIDDPLLQKLQQDSQEYILAFTNPATVEGTMARVHEALQQDKTSGQADVAAASRTKAALIPGTFELIMRGDKEGYMNAVTTGLQQLAAQSPEKQLLPLSCPWLPPLPLLQQMQVRRSTARLHPLHHIWSSNCILACVVIKAVLLPVAERTAFSYHRLLKLRCNELRIENGIPQPSPASRPLQPHSRTSLCLRQTHEYPA